MLKTAILVVFLWPYSGANSSMDNSLGHTPRFADVVSKTVEGAVVTGRYIPKLGVSVVHLDHPAADLFFPRGEDLVLTMPFTAVTGHWVVEGKTHSHQLAPGRIGVRAPGVATEVHTQAAKWLALSLHKDAALEYIEPHSSTVEFADFHLTNFSEPMLEHVFRFLWSELQVARNESLLLVESAATLLLRAALDRRRLDALLAKGPSGLSPWQVRIVLERIHASATYDISLKDLANLVNLSPFHFARAFKVSTGFPPHQYQLRLRLTKAQELASSTSLDSRAIASAVGYGSSQALSKLFVRHLGKSLDQYMAELRSASK